MQRGCGKSRLYLGKDVNGECDICIGFYFCTNFKDNKCKYISNAISLQTPD